MKFGIILAGGRSTRLYPATLSMTKQLLPVYDKPLLFYPLTTLMLAGIKDFVIITNPDEIDNVNKLMRASKLSGFLHYDVLPQHQPNGIPEAFNIVRNIHPDSIQKYESVTLVLGDNIFHGATMSGMINEAVQKSNASIFVTKVPDLTRFGVIDIFDLTVKEKPITIDRPKSTYVITGLYHFPTSVFEVAHNLKPSVRGETEITDVIRHYANEKMLDVNVMKRGVTWFDTGTPDSMLDAAHYVKTVQSNAGQLVGSPHEVGFKNGWMSKYWLSRYLETDNKSQYSKYLSELLHD